MTTEKQTPEAWRPIKTAPRDGSNILLRFGSDGVSQGKYVPGTPYPWKFIDTNDGVTWLVNHAVDDRGGPSHWMPLPSTKLAALACATSQQEPCETCGGGGYISDHGEARDCPRCNTAPPVQQSSQGTEDYNALLSIVGDIVGIGHMNTEDLARLRAHLTCKPEPVQQGPMGREGCNYMCMPGKVCRKCGHVHDTPLNTPPVQQADDEVTPEMVRAGAKAASEYMKRTGGNDPAVIYRAMRAAAKTAEQQALKDAERLDWLDANAGMRWDSGYDVIEICIHGSEGVEIGKTVRETLDAAIAATKKE